MTFAQKLAEYEAWVAGGQQGAFDNAIAVSGDSAVKFTLGSDGQPCPQFTLVASGQNTKSIDLPESQRAALLALNEAAFPVE